jgi:hypothetical protein
MCNYCNDDQCEGCPPEGHDLEPSVLALENYQPAVEPMSLDEWERREDVVLEDRRAEQAARAAWLRKVTERRAA